MSILKRMSSRNAWRELVLMLTSKVYMTKKENGVISFEEEFSALFMSSVMKRLRKV